MTTARDFFERVSAASVDVERCRQQLVQLESRAKSLGGGGFEPRTRSTPEHDVMARRVGAYVDRERALESRVAEDYDLIDRACLVLYGSDSRRGLDSVQSPVWADVLWWKYLDCAKWSTVSRSVGYSVRTCQSMAAQALAWIDESRFMSDVMGAS